MKRYTICLLAILTVLLCGCKGYPICREEENQTKLMMDTVCTIRAGGKSAREAVSAAFARIEEIASAVDYFSETSDVTRINMAEANQGVKVCQDVVNIIDKALEISEASGGAFDITVAHFKDLWDISGGAHKPPAEREIERLLETVSYNQVLIDKEVVMVTKKKKDTKIDLGGAAKGYAADCAVEVLKQLGAEYGIVDLGGNITVFGKNPDRADGRWNVGIQKPFGNYGEIATTVSIEEGAAVTAGTYQRYFEWDGEIYHHIIDPKTGCPSDSGTDSASIVAESALLADCLATACVVMSREEAEKLVNSYGAKLITF